MTNEKCQKLIEEKVDRNATKGIVGDFYTTNRKQDIIFVVNEILNERRKEKL